MFVKHCISLSPRGKKSLSFTQGHFCSPLKIKNTCFHTKKLRNLQIFLYPKAFPHQFSSHKNRLKLEKWITRKKNLTCPSGLL